MKPAGAVPLWSVLLVIVREVFDLKDYITINHLEKMNKIIMTTGMMVGYAYAWRKGALEWR